MIITVALLMIGIMVLIGGVYFLIREKADPESRKIYLITIAAGIIIIIGVIAKIVLVGF